METETLADQISHKRYWLDWMDKRCQVWSVIRGSARMKAEAYKAALRLAVQFGLEIVGLRKT